MKTTVYKNFIASLVLMVFFSAAQAGFNLTRMTTIVDDFSGSYTVTKSGRLEGKKYSGTSVTEFTNFHPFLNKNDVSLSGTLSKIIERGNAHSSNSDAILTLISPEKTLNISFTGLSHEVVDGEVILAGEITANDETFAVSDLPVRLKKLLKRIFFLTRK